MDPTGVTTVVSHLAWSTASRIPCANSLSSSASTLALRAKVTCHGFKWMGVTWGFKLNERGVPVYLPRPSSNMVANSLIKADMFDLLTELMPEIANPKESNQSRPIKLYQL